MKTLFFYNINHKIFTLPEYRYTELNIQIQNKYYTQKA